MRPSIHSVIVGWRTSSLQLLTSAEIAGPLSLCSWLPCRPVVQNVDTMLVNDAGLVLNSAYLRSKG